MVFDLKVVFIKKEFLVKFGYQVQFGNKWPIFFGFLLNGGHSLCMYIFPGLVREYIQYWRGKTAWLIALKGEQEKNIL